MTTITPQAIIAHQLDPELTETTVEQEAAEINADLAERGDTPYTWVVVHEGFVRIDKGEGRYRAKITYWLDSEAPEDAFTDGDFAPRALLFGIHPTYYDRDADAVAPVTHDLIRQALAQITAED